MMGYLVDDIAERLASRQEGDGWQVRRSSVSKASPGLIVDLTGNRSVITLHHVNTRSYRDGKRCTPRSPFQSCHLGSTSINGPFEGQADRIGRYRWVLSKISISTSPSRSQFSRHLGAYSSWFATQTHPPPSSTPSAEPNLLLTVLSYVVSALPDPSLSLPAATALRNLCEANRKDLASHIGAFGELHAGLNNIPVRYWRDIARVTFQSDILTGS